MPIPPPKPRGLPRTCQDGFTFCGAECCPTNLICNKNIPGVEFHDGPSDPNIGAGVTVVSQLGFNAQALNTSVGAKPTGLGSDTLFTATTAVMEGTGPYSQGTTISKSLTGFSGGSMTASSAIASGVSSGILLRVRLRRVWRLLRLLGLRLSRELWWFRGFWL